LGEDWVAPERGDAVLAPSLVGSGLLAESGIWSAAAFPPVGVIEINLEGFMVDEKHNRAYDLLGELET
jgi:hypothetical protein